MSLRIFRYFAALFLMTAVAAPVHATPLLDVSVVAGHTRTQQIGLRKGWNAVFLEVDPALPDPGGVFAGSPIDVVAALFPGSGPTQFVTNPAADLGKSRGWAVWYAPERPEAFLKSLDAVYGNQTYLIHSKSDFQWSVRGRVKLLETRWQPNSFNLVGFPVRGSGGPTFGEFFGGSKAHAGQAIYRLEDGAWKRVLQPAAAAMKSGEAFWIFCKGESAWEGPLQVECKLHQGVVAGAGKTSFVLRNAGIHPVSAVIEHQPGEGAGVPLSVMVQMLGDPAAPVRSVPVVMPAGAWSQPLPPIEAGQAFEVPLECRTQELAGPEAGSLLKITSDVGTEIWVPVTGIRDDLAP